MDWIAITGVMGAGKSTVSARIESLGYPVAYADRVAREVVKPGSYGLSQVVEAFGKQVLSPQSELDRKKLAELVFQSKLELVKLEQILHPLIRDNVELFKKRAQERGYPFAFYDIPLLFEKQQESRFDTIVCVTAKFEVIYQRLKAREGWDRSEVNRRLSHQMSEQVKISKSQYVLKNDSTRKDLFLQVDQLISSLKTDPKKNPHKKL